MKSDPVLKLLLAAVLAMQALSIIVQHRDANARMAFDIKNRIDEINSAPISKGHVEPVKKSYIFRESVSLSGDAEGKIPALWKRISEWSERGDTVESVTRVGTTDTFDVLLSH